MERFTNILFFFNPKVKQNAAMRRAGSLAKRNNARLTVLSVVKGLAVGQHLPVPDEAIDELESQAIHAHSMQVEELAGRFRKAGVDAHAKVVVGIAFIEIISAVLREQHDLVILAPDGRHGLISRLFGSVSTHLMRKCPCPVWVVKPGSGKSYQRILAAVDLFSDPWDAAEESLNTEIVTLSSTVARMDHAELHLLHVWDLANEGWLGGPSVMGDKAFRKLLDETRADLRKRLDAAVQGIDRDGIGGVQSHLKKDEDPGEGIVKLVHKEAIDLLVMGTVCRTGLAGFLIGNTAEEVLGAVDCSVLTVKPKGFVSPVTLVDQ